MISLWKLREKKNVAQMPFVKNTPDLSSACIKYHFMAGIRHSMNSNWTYSLLQPYCWWFWTHAQIARVGL